MSEENEEFTVIWKIKNFTYCLQKKLEPLNSPAFIVNSFELTRWNLLLYPRGVEDDKDVSFYLHRKNEGPETISLDYEMSIINSEGVATACVEVKNHAFTVQHGFGASEFISRKDLEKDRNIFLPDDTLTVRCRMWYCGIQPSPKGCNLSTCIGVDKGTFNWSIKNFSSLRVNEERTLSLESSTKDYPAMLLKMSLTGGYLHDRNVKIEISQSDAQRANFVVLNVQVLSVYGKSLEIAEHEHFFEKKEGIQVWKFPPFITKEKMIGKQSIYLPGDVFTLKCNCIMSVGVVSEEIEYDDSETIADQTSIESLPNATSTPNNELCNILKKQRRRRLQNAHMPFPDRSDLSEVSLGFRSDLQNLYQDPILPDVTLRVCGKIFPAHKALLSARSPVFKAMFTSDMRERDKEFIELLDIEPETMHRFLLYIYTDTTEENIDWSAVAKLYFASDTYEVLSLKQKCSDFLKRNLFPGNVLEVLELADMHHDDDLKLSALQFILMNDHQIIGSDTWKKFEESNPGFAYETIRDVYMMKLNIQTMPKVL